MQVKELSYQYSHKKVLDLLSFDLKPGEIVGLLGVNGAGKSTLLNVLSGLYPVQSGTIYFNGSKVAGPHEVVSRALRARMGVVFQSCSLDDKLSAKANLNLSGFIYGMPKDKRDIAIESALIHTGLSEIKKRPVKTFSGGMKRKLELARAFLHEPDLLLMDEPTAGLDPEAFQKFWAQIMQRREQNKTRFFLATHRVDEAEKCDRLLVLHKGQLVKNDSPQELMKTVKGDRLLLRFEKSASSEQKNQWANQLQTLFAELPWQWAKDNAYEAIADEGARLVPRVVEALPTLAIESVFVRKPTLADAFLHITGENLK